jgi:hypothetical protein
LIEETPVVSTLGFESEKKEMIDIIVFLSDFILEKKLN